LKEICVKKKLILALSRNWLFLSGEEEVRRWNKRTHGHPAGGEGFSGNGDSRSYGDAIMVSYICSTRPPEAEVGTYFDFV